MKTALYAIILLAVTASIPQSSFGGKRRGGPPEPFADEVTIPPGEGCPFAVVVGISGKNGIINLPNGGMLITFPATSISFTNADDPAKTVTFAGFTGVNHVSPPDQNGNTTLTLTGRTAFFDPDYGFVILEGEFSFFVDATGFVFPPPKGHGRIINLCDLID